MNPFYWCLLGTAIGDSIGLPREGLSRRRAKRIFGGPPLEHSFFFGYGAVSDDAEHACLTAQALIASAGEPELFAKELARRLRWWLLMMPAGIGLATLRAILKLWLGFSPATSGVRSAGNGPAMRATILGVFAANDLQKLARLVRISTRITHTDPRAEQGAMIVALAAAYSLAPPRGEFAAADFLRFVMPYVADDGLRANLTAACEAASRGESAEQFADSLGCTRGVSGFINHSVPVAIFCWLRHRDNFRAAIESAVCLGGDTDTVAAIVGGVLGARVRTFKTMDDERATPDSWLEGILMWPRRGSRSMLPLELWLLRSNYNWMAGLSEQLPEVAQTGQPQRPFTRPWPIVLVRNALFAALVLLHGFRRLLPPY
jgi:ADP-ribosylglycohydrolase